MGALKQQQIMGEDLQLHLGAYKVPVNAKGQYEFRFQEHHMVPAQSCEAALLWLWEQTDMHRGVDKRGYSRFDADFAISLCESIVRYGDLTDGQLRAIQKTKDQSGKNGLIMKYRGQLEKAGFYVPALLEQKAARPVNKARQYSEL